MKYQIVEFLPGVYRARVPGLLWGWRWVAGTHGMPAEWLSVESAESDIGRWRKYEAHIIKVVKEI